MYKRILKLPQLNKSIEINNNDDNLLNILRQNEILLYSPCGGNGTCGKCKVQVTGNINEITEEEKKYLSKEEISRGIRLACKTYILGEAKVYLSDSKLENNSKRNLESRKQYKIDSIITKKVIRLNAPTLENNISITDCIKDKLGDIKIDLDILIEVSNNIDYYKDVTVTLYEDQLIDIEHGNTTDKKYGIAVDIGTTTIACYLIDLNNGRQLEVQSAQNPQIGFGSDIVSRIKYCLENEGGLNNLSNKIRKAIDKLIYEVSKRANVDRRHIYQCVLVGNTTMNHLFWGFNPKSLSKFPFNPVTKDMIIQKAGKIGIENMNNKGKVIFLPNIGGFVGSDTIGAIIASNLINMPNNILLIDLGTNGEIVLSTSTKRYACSTAAGPAFEGARIKNGMQAFSGAIDKVRIEDDLYYTTIDNKPPKGICGSGLIDIISEFLRVGIIEESGKIVDPDSLDNKKLSQRIIKKGRRKEVIIAYENETESGQVISIEQKDIREIQLAKAAIRAGINILLKIANIQFKDINNILIAGAFGNYINKESARRIGIFPHIELNKIVLLGNAAGEGAKIALCDKAILTNKTKECCLTTKHIELSIHPDFHEEFVDAMYFK